MQLEAIYRADDISIRDEGDYKLVYQYNQDHMYLIPNLGVKILEVFKKERSLRSGLETIGIFWSELPALSQDKLSSFISDLVERGLLYEISRCAIALERWKEVNSNDCLRSDIRD